MSKRWKGPERRVPVDLGKRGKKPIVGDRRRNLDADRARLKRQLPEEMQDCTIAYKACQAGHGRLIATNWIDHGCHWCELDRLRAVETTRERHSEELSRGIENSH